MDHSNNTCQLLEKVELFNKLYLSKDYKEDESFNPETRISQETGSTIKYIQNAQRFCVFLS